MSGIKLRELEEQDLDNLYNLVSSDNVSRYMRFDTYTSKEKCKELLSYYLERNNKAFVLELEKDFVGVFVLKGIDMCVVEMSTFLSEKYWGKGFSTEILTKIIDYSNINLPDKILQAYVVEENIGSRKVLEKNNFKLFKEFRFDGMTENIQIYRLRIKS